MSTGLTIDPDGTITMPSEKTATSSCDHTDFLPYGSLTMMQTVTTCTDESTGKQINHWFPTSYFAFCPVCGKNVTDKCLTPEEVRTRIGWGWGGD